MGGILDEYSNIWTHWIALCALNNNATYFDSFGVEQIPKKLKKSIEKSPIETNIFRIQEYDSLICRYFSIRFINFMFKCKSLTDFTNLFSPKTF